MGASNKKLPTTAGGGPCPYKLLEINFEFR